MEELKEEYPREEINSFFYLLAEAFLGMSRLELALDPNLMTAEAEIGRFEDALERLKQHEPVQHIIGETEFFGLKFRVNTNVLIPRPETEELVQWILDDSSSEKKELKILDIGTGSGCIAVSLAKYLPQAEVFAIDIS
ncbi:MAG: HemK/PrmC family methyltransferase, partial [Salegentibacter sp.]